MIHIQALTKDISGQYILTLNNDKGSEQLVIDPRTGMHLQKLLNKLNGIVEEEPTIPFRPKSIFSSAVPGLPTSKPNG